VNLSAVSVFDLPERLAAKADPALIAADQHHFEAIAETLDQSIAELSQRLEQERRAPAGRGQRALDRDQEVHRLTGRLRTLRRFGVDLCLGQMIGEDAQPVYIGRLGLSDPSGKRLLIDWRSPAAEPFFAATHARPMGLVSRRRYQWNRGRIIDYWDEVFTADAMAGHAAALDDQSAFIASLAGNRSERMRDVLGTIAADQDAVIRAGSAGALVVDGGPGTGKTVVALHRAAYLLYTDPRLGHRRGGVLVVGPHQPYLNYVGDVLPSLGEEGVQTCTVRDLVAEGPAVSPESDPDVARLKAGTRVGEIVDAAVQLYEEPPGGIVVSTPWSDGRLTARDWAAAFAAVGTGTPHNEAREQILDELIEMLIDRLDEPQDGDSSPEQIRKVLRQNGELNTALNRAWPMLEAEDIVGDLWTVPAYLRRCAPWLTAGEAGSLQRKQAQAWTVSDLPFLDAARRRLGDPGAARRRRRIDAEREAERQYRSEIIDDLILADDSEMLVMSMLRGDDMQNALDDEPEASGSELGALAGPFAHIIVDEAQELTDAEWQMLLARCPSRSFTVVGDRAQARHGFAETWQQRLERVGFDRITRASLTINYRTPEEIMAEAEPVILAVLPDANVPVSIRSGGQPVAHDSWERRDAILAGWLGAHDEGIACVIGDPSFEATSRVRSLTPQLAKGLEFDLVVLVDPHRFGTGIEGAVDRYVAMTRATGQLVVLTSSDSGQEG